MWLSKQSKALSVLLLSAALAFSQACSPDDGVDGREATGTLTQGLFGDMAGSPRIIPVYLKVAGATVGGSVGYLDTLLGVKCKPELTSEKKTRCIPVTARRGMPGVYDLPDMADMEMPGRYFSDNACTKTLSAAKAGLMSSTVIGRYSVFKELLPESEGVNSQLWVTRVYIITAKIPMPTQQTIFQPFSVGAMPTCGLNRTLDASSYPGKEFYEGAPVALTDFAEMTESY